MTWNDFLWFALPSVAAWIVAGTRVYSGKKAWITDGFMLLGITVFAAFIVALWIGQNRPPLQTMGETRLWYSFFLATAGYITYKRWKYKWMLSYSNVMASVFVCINILKPEIHSAHLMPALQSYWFVPHVTVYILSYALLGAATIASFIQMKKKNRGVPDESLYRFMDNIVRIGLGFLLLGMLMGAVWAKEAWGDYWSWDPKETWAFITAIAYLLYIHLRLQKQHPKFTLALLPVAFVFLMITWIGVNYLPAAQGSIHAY
jgi:ABC-type transport system involved in cytochrome c biogenesis permease subunit